MYVVFRTLFRRFSKFITYRHQRRGLRVEHLCYLPVLVTLDRPPHSARIHNDFTIRHVPASPHTGGYSRTRTVPDCVLPRCISYSRELRLLCNMCQLVHIKLSNMSMSVYDSL